MPVTAMHPALDDELIVSSRAALSEPLTSRYLDLGLVASGGMGEVHKVFDRELERTLAMKIIRHSLPTEEEGIRRFTEEARITGRLQHPAIIPVHDAGRLDDGRLFYTMRLVEGHTLREVIGTTHHNAHAAGSLEDGVALRPLIEAFRRVCEAVAFAHSQGVIHRDLKPSNVMVGDFGEVLVVDWGLAQRTLRSGLNTGSRLPLMGTPAYMAPELARGEEPHGTPASDVYALGAILYEILSGRAPYVGLEPGVVLAQVLAGPPPPPRPLAWSAAQTTRGATAWDIPKEDTSPQFVAEPALVGSQTPLNVLMGEALIEACARAMARTVDERFPDAASLAGAVSAWLEGSQRRRHAATLVETVAPLEQARRDCLAQAAALQEGALEVLSRIEPWRPLDDKRAGWALRDQAQAQQAKADAAEAAWLEGLQAALVHDPDLPEAHRLLANYYREEHALAEARRDLRVTARCERMLRAHDREGRHSAYLRGESRFSLFTDPPGAQVTLWKLETQDLRLVPTSPQPLGVAPLLNRTIGIGSYLAILEKPGYAPVRYPIWVGRDRPWSILPPAQADAGRVPRPVRLVADLGPEQCYVPAGWFQKGGDPKVTDPSPLTWEWLEGFIIQQFPVTNAQYLTFLNEVLEKEGEARAIMLAPCERGAPFGEALPPPIYHRDARGRFILGPDADGDVWHPDMPVIHIDFACAQAYAAWWSEQTGQAWTLPTEDQWEKAARGVDARVYPWGDDYDPIMACVADSRPGGMMIADVTEFPFDESVYGVRGLAGNVQDWCLDVWKPRSLSALARSAQSPMGTEQARLPRVMRGGAWRGTSMFCRCAERSWTRPTARVSSLGMRLVRAV